MQIKTKEFQEVVNKILLAIDSHDKTAANVELVAKQSSLYLNVTNKEYYVAVKFPIDGELTDPFRAVVDASLFLSLISGLTTETFDLNIVDNNIVITTGKSNYKVAMIYENDKLMELPVIHIKNKTVEMTISNDILTSIINVNSKEVQKAKSIADATELQKLYYIDETGCFTFTNSACLNSFTLEKPVKLLLNDRIIKLFKLFKEDVLFSLGQDPLPNGTIRTKMVMETENVYLAAVITCDDVLLSKVQAPCMATKRYVKEAYDYKVVVSATALSAAITRLMAFHKFNKSGEKPNMIYLPVRLSITADDITMIDKFKNSESVNTENGSYIEGAYDLYVNIADVKSVLDSSKLEHITLNCGNRRSMVITRGTVSNLIPELDRSKVNF